MYRLPVGFLNNHCFSVPRWAVVISMLPPRSTLVSNIAFFPVPLLLSHYSSSFFLPRVPNKLIIPTTEEEEEKVVWQRRVGGRTKIKKKRKRNNLGMGSPSPRPSLLLYGSLPKIFFGGSNYAAAAAAATPRMTKAVHTIHTIKQKNSEDGVLAWDDIFSSSRGVKPFTSDDRKSPSLAYKLASRKNTWQEGGEFQVRCNSKKVDLHFCAIF